MMRLTSLLTVAAIGVTSTVHATSIFGIGNSLTQNANLKGVSDMASANLGITLNETQKSLGLWSHVGR
jgi:hypothetical protein